MTIRPFPSRQRRGRETRIREASKCLLGTTEARFNHTAIRGTGSTEGTGEILGLNRKQPRTAAAIGGGGIPWLCRVSRHRETRAIRITRRREMKQNWHRVLRVSVLGRGKSKSKRGGWAGTGSARVAPVSARRAALAARL